MQNLPQWTINAAKNILHKDIDEMTIGKEYIIAQIIADAAPQYPDIVALESLRPPDELETEEFDADIAAVIEEYKKQEVVPIIRTLSFLLEEVEGKCCCEPDSGFKCVYCYAGKKIKEFENC